MTPVTLQTARLVLRPWLPSDRAPFAALNADPEVMAHLPGVLSRPESDAFADRVEAHFGEHGYGLWALEEAGAFVGYTGLQWSDVLGPPALEVGWRLARAAWGRGLATEAARAAVAEGLRHVDRVVSFTVPANTRSLAVMRRVGLVEVGTFDHPRPGLPPHLVRHVLHATP